MQSVVDRNVPLFSNGFVKCYSDYLVINLYYFPFGSKKVRYINIRSCEYRSMNDMDMFSYKLWGMSLSPIWWHCDMNRWSRQSYLLLDANQWPQIGLTMDDKDLITVYYLIREKISPNQSNIYQEKVYSSPSQSNSEKEVQEQKSF